MNEIATNAVSERPIYLLNVPKFDDLVNAFETNGEYFGLFVVSDSSRVSIDSISDVAESALRSGLVYLCAWGPDCERVHDIFDEVIVGENPNETEKSVIMTSWHAKDSLDEALWFFLHTAFPADDYIDETKVEIVAVVGNEEWADQIRKRLLDQAAFNEEILNAG
jgi:hypothetical protein